MARRLRLRNGQAAAAAGGWVQLGAGGGSAASTERARQLQDSVARPASPRRGLCGLRAERPPARELPRARKPSGQSTRERLQTSRAPEGDGGGGAARPPGRRPGAAPGPSKGRWIAQTSAWKRWWLTCMPPARVAPPPPHWISLASPWLQIRSHAELARHPPLGLCILCRFTCHYQRAAGKPRHVALPSAQP